jgi:hypothetical protein
MNNIKNFIFQDEYWERSYNLANKLNTSMTPVLCYDDLGLDGFQSYKYWSQEECPEVVLIHKDFLGCMHEVFFKRINEYKCIFEYGCHQLYLLLDNVSVNKVQQAYISNMYNNQRRVGFVHIPKTAGTSIWNILASNIYGSVYFSNDEEFMRVVGTKKFKCLAGHVPLSVFTSMNTSFDYLFTVFRAPKDRFLSAVGHARRNPSDYANMTTSMQCMFDQSLMEFSLGEFMYREAHMQSRYMGWEDNDNSFVDAINKSKIEIFKVDELDQLINNIFDVRDEELSLQRKNVTKNKEALFTAEEIKYIESEEFNSIFDEENRRLSLIA